MMNPMLHCVAPLLVVAPVITTSPVPAADTSRVADARVVTLHAHEDASLLGMRAGAPATSALDAVQRDALQQAQANAPELAGQRAGELSNSDLTTILLVALIILVVVIII